MSDTATENTIREFLIHDVFYDRDLSRLGSDQSLLEAGLLDSLSILKIVTFCEESFGITIPDVEVLPDHFDSVRSIAALVERRRAAKACAAGDRRRRRVTGPGRGGAGTKPPALGHVGNAATVAGLHLVQCRSAKYVSASLARCSSEASGVASHGAAAARDSSARKPSALR